MDPVFPREQGPLRAQTSTPEKGESLSFAASSRKGARESVGVIELKDLIMSWLCGLVLLDLVRDS